MPSCFLNEGFDLFLRKAELRESKHDMIDVGEISSKTNAEVDTRIALPDWITGLMTSV